jgi:polynucleotide 5'-hydroxyl-kinase GRC3/NOL9
MLNLKFSLSEDLISKILNPQIKTIFILGASDTGKTTLIECLLEILIGNYSIGVVDCDMGQSHIGPPTTIGWAKVKEKFNFWEELKLEDFYFTGSLSPSGNIQRTLEGVRFIFGKAKEKTDKVIFDTTGYISGYEAIDFKIKKIEQILPDLIIALQRGNELEDILKNFKDKPIFRMDIPKEVMSKSQEERQRYRDRCFKRYFQNAKEFFFPEEIFERLNEEDTDIIKKIVSLQNDKEKDLALGIIKKREDKSISILTSWNNIEEVSRIIVGLCKWEGI